MLLILCGGLMPLRMVEMEEVEEVVKVVQVVEEMMRST